MGHGILEDLQQLRNSVGWRVDENPDAEVLELTLEVWGPFDLRIGHAARSLAVCAVGAGRVGPAAVGSESTVVGGRTKARDGRGIGLEKRHVDGPALAAMIARVHIQDLEQILLAQQDKIPGDLHVQTMPVSQSGTQTTSLTFCIQASFVQVYGRISRNPGMRRVYERGQSEGWESEQGEKRPAEGPVVR